MDQEYKFGKNILVLSIMTLITVIVWVGYEVYSTYTQATVPRIIKELTKPLNPNIDEEAIEDIQEKYQIPEEELNVVTQSIIELETEEEEETEEEIEPEEEATPSPTPD